MQSARFYCLCVFLPPLLALVVLLLLMVVFLYSTNPARKCPLPVIARQPPNFRHASCRIRFANIQLLPVPYLYSSRNKALRLLRGGIFKAVDVVFMQEAFSRILLDREDVLSHINRIDRSLVFACAEAPLPPGYFTDSGLAAAAAYPCSVSFVAFKGFSQGKYACAFSYKGVCVFEVNTTPPLRIANTHLQAVSIHDAIQKVQFEKAVAFALMHDAVLLGGDINVSKDAHLEAMTAEVYRQTSGRGHYVSHDMRPTCCKAKSGGNAYRKPALRLDHVWILDASRVSCSHIITRDDLTDGITDHACLELTISPVHGGAVFSCPPYI